LRSSKSLISSDTSSVGALMVTLLVTLSASAAVVEPLYVAEPLHTA
jgi:hypothetical protein